MKKIPKKLAFRLILALTLIVIIVEGISGIISIKSHEKQLIQAMILGADQLSRGITIATWHGMLEDHREAVYEVMQKIALKEGISSIRIFNKEGRVMFSTSPIENPQVDKRAEACYLCHVSEQPLLRVDTPSRARIFHTPDGSRKLAIVTPIYNEPSCSQAACHAHPPEMNVLGVLDIALDLTAVDKELTAITYRMFVSTGLHISLIGLFIILFSWRFIGIPIRKLIDGTRAVSDMHLDQPIEVHSSIELGELARSFNVMRERLVKAIREINQFTQSLEAKVEERTAQLDEAYQKLAQQDRLSSLGQLAASVVHEINNPISGILNLTMLMQRILREDGIPPDRVAEFRKYLDEVVGETSRTGRIVSDLLAFSRQTETKDGRGNLTEAIHHTLSIVSPKLDLAGVHIELDLENALPDVTCSNDRLQQVVVNLVLNGAEAIHDRKDGKIQIQTKRAFDNSSVYLLVTDNGEGIPPENVTKIFDPFFTTKDDGKGVGLGLAVVYGIVKAQGGEIAVISEVNQGTTFRVTFPTLASSKENNHFGSRS